MLKATQLNIIHAFRSYPYIIIESFMPFEQKTQVENGQTKIHSFACFEQQETIQILEYLRQTSLSTLQFTYADRRTKEFLFQKIYHQRHKFKYEFEEDINNMVSAVLAGKTQAAFIYGTEQSRKNKILIGEPQNPGLLLSVLSSLFETCHRRQLEEYVTIKISCAIYQDGKFTDIYGAVDLQPKHRAQNPLYSDLIESGLIFGLPEVIIRNLKTASKVMTIMQKRVMERRQLGKEATENLLYTIKVEIDKCYDTEGQTYQFGISKLHIIKLANPSANSTLNGISKANCWFISLFNYLQNALIKENGSSVSQGFSNSSEEDYMTKYLREAVLPWSWNIYNFTSITNKMTSNQCLTAMIFNNYLLAYKARPTKMILNVQQINHRKNQLEQELLSQLQAFGSEQQPISFRRSVISQLKIKCHKQDSMDTNMDWDLKLQLHRLLQLNNKLQILGNRVEYQYAGMLSKICNKLGKYILGEDIEEYFYSKKYDTQVHQDLVNSLGELLDAKHQAIAIMKSILKKVKHLPLLNELFDLYSTSTCHYFYNSSTSLEIYLNQQKDSILYVFSRKSQIFDASQVANGFIKEKGKRYRTQIEEKQNEQGISPQRKKKASIDMQKTIKNWSIGCSYRAQQDELSMMFTNPNVGYKHK